MPAGVSSCVQWRVCFAPAIPLGKGGGKGGRVGGEGKWAHQASEEAAAVIRQRCPVEGEHWMRCEPASVDDGRGSSCCPTLRPPRLAVSHLLEQPWGRGPSVLLLLRNRVRRSTKLQHELERKVVTKKERRERPSSRPTRSPFSSHALSLNDTTAQGRGKKQLLTINTRRKWTRGFTKRDQREGRGKKTGEARRHERVETMRRVSRGREEHGKGERREVGGV